MTVYYARDLTMIGGNVNKAAWMARSEQDYDFGYLLVDVVACYDYQAEDRVSIVCMPEVRVLKTGSLRKIDKDEFKHIVQNTRAKILAKESKLRWEE